VVNFVFSSLKFFRGLLVSFALLLLFLVQFVDQLVLMRNLVIKVTNLVVFCCFVLLRLLDSQFQVLDVLLETSNLLLELLLALEQLVAGILFLLQPFLRVMQL